MEIKRCTFWLDFKNEEKEHNWENVVNAETNEYKKQNSLP